MAMQRRPVRGVSRECIVLVLLLSIVARCLCEVGGGNVSLPNDHIADSAESGNAEWVDVFTMGEEGYYCIKIPYILSTQAGTLIAFAEGRRNSCSDFTWTDLVMKRSSDLGRTWGKLEILYSNSTANESNVIGNAAPVQDAASGRIVVPFCRNNQEVWITYSEDDGQSWSAPVNISSTTTHPQWKWIGTGPPAALQLASGRIVVPSYHSRLPYITDGEISHSHVMISDDGGDTWRIGGSLSPSLHLSNECQCAQLGNGSLWMNARSLTTVRLQSLSNDEGETWGDVSTIDGLVEPLEGCEGSTIRDAERGMLFFSIPNNKSALRYNMTVFVSRDEAASWEVLKVVNEGRSAYSALTKMANNDIGLLFERSNLPGVIFVPQQISFTVVYSDSSERGSRVGSDREHSDAKERQVGSIAP